MNAHINGNLVRMIVDIGSNSTIISRGAAKAMNLDVHAPSESTTFSGVNGVSEAYEGTATNVTFTLHDKLEFDVDTVRVSANDGYLILLGNDLLTDNMCYSYKGNLKDKFVGTFMFHDLRNDVQVNVKAQMGHPKYDPSAQVNFVNSNMTLCAMDSYNMVPSKGTTNFEFAQLTSVFNEYFVDTPRSLFDKVVG
jgi:gag-polyprotein putative aspartyl protease